MTEPRKRVIVDGIEFTSVVQFPRILTAALAALQPPRLIIGLLIVTALVTGGRIWDRIAAPTLPPGGLTAPALTEADRARAQDVLRQTLSAYDVVPEGETLEAREVARRITSVYAAARRAGEPVADERVVAQTLQAIDGVRPHGAFEATARMATNAFSRVMHGVLTLRPGETLDAGIDLFVRMPGTLWAREKPFSIIYGLFALLMLTVGGGALSRMAACHWSGGERLKMSEAWDFAFSNFWSFFTAPLLPVVLAGIVAAVIAGLGSLLRLPWVFELIGALGYGIAMVLGALVAFLALGYALGFPLLVPAVACERCDAAEAQQRAYAYVLNRPFHRVGYGLVALVGLALGYLVVSLFVVIMLQGTAAIFGTFAGDQPALAGIGQAELFRLTGSGTPVIYETGPQRWSAEIMGFFETVVLCLVAAWVLSYFFSAATLNYLLMRRACDGQEIQEIWRPGPRVPGSTPSGVASS